MYVERFPEKRHIGQRQNFRGYLFRLQLIRFWAKSDEAFQNGESIGKE